MRSRSAVVAAALAACACVALAAAPGADDAAPDARGATPGGREPTMHTVFSAECTPYFDWQSIALVRSHKLARAPRASATASASHALPRARRSACPAPSRACWRATRTA